MGSLVSFAMEKIPPDLTALTLFSVLLATGLLPIQDALTVFSNPAPITVGAMFILSAALERSGAIEGIAARLQKLARLGYRSLVFILVLTVAGLSAFINNTPVVVVFLPIVLSLAHTMKIPASKLLIPLSYASIFGGICTLIGTSTNILVNGLAIQAGEPGFGMFEFAFIGVPILLAGALYLVIFGNRLLPVRETLTSILSEDERREYITEAFVSPTSTVIGKTLKEAGLLDRRGIRPIDLVRFGVPMQANLMEVKLQAGDRLVLACRPSGLAHARSLEGVDLLAEIGLGLEQIASHEGMIVEAVIGPNSQLSGRSITEVNFRQRYRMIVLAVHRHGKNVREKLAHLPLQFGDTLLLLGTDGAIQNLRGNDDLLLIDRRPIPTSRVPGHLPLVLGTIAAVVGLSAFNLVKIEMGAIIGCVVLMLAGCIRPKEGYQAVQWNILFIIFGMLGMGIAMERTGTSTLLAETMIYGVNLLVAEEWRPFVMLACIFLITSTLTEILSNNAAAVLMATIAIGAASVLGVEMKPFLIAVALAGSASFATPIGYQTNTYVYGVGGYRFADFVKIGLPLNLLCFVIAMIVIPLVWSF
ncbi:MAG: SLC13 family permease [Puniceicoccaceae bacterium]|nr:MAG: SLC13 family permease [Puniceicoccaceae bacterium]